MVGMESAIKELLQEFEDDYFKKDNEIHIFRYDVLEAYIMRAYEIGKMVEKTENKRWIFAAVKEATK